MTSTKTAESDTVARQPTPSLTEEQRSLRDAARTLFTAQAGREARRDYVDQQAPYDADLWKRMADELGLHAILVDAEYDGAGGTLLDMAVVLEEAGAALLCGPFLATAVLGASAIGMSPDDALKAEMLPALVSGDLVCGVAFPAPTGNSNSVDALRTDRGWSLTGGLTHVLNGADADVLIVAADGGDRNGNGMFLIPATDTGVEIREQSPLDATRRLTTANLSGAIGRRIDAVGDDAWTNLLQTARVAISAEQVGVAQRCLDMSVDYASNRHQFGRPIGSFQAVKHRCADMFVDVTSARAVMHHAAWMMSTNPADAEMAVCAAGAIAAEASLRVAASAIQIHGGIGYTWEHDAHLYLKRAMTSASFLETRIDRRDRLAELIGL